MKLKFLVVMVSVGLLYFSCKEEKKQPESTSQMKQVMAVHDEVMPKMSTIGKLVAELKPKVDSTEMGVQYEKAMKDLQASNKAMMDWMKGFGDRFDPDEIMNGAELSDQKKEWLDEEEEKVEALRDQINASIANAEALLEKE